MKKLLSVFCLLAFITNGLQAVSEPDISEQTTYKEVCQQLMEYSSSYLDLRIAKANMLLSSRNFYRTHREEFPGLDCLESMYAEYRSPAKLVAPEIIHNDHDENNNCEKQKQKVAIENLVCEVSSGDLLIHYTLEERLMTTKMMYISFRDLAKKEINPLLTDENFEVLFYVSQGERIDGKWIENREPICKWSKGVGLYYAKFMENKNEDMQHVCDRNVESGLTEQEVLQIFKN